jgi:hypothetical protein
MHRKKDLIAAIMSARVYEEISDLLAHRTEIDEKSNAHGHEGKSEHRCHSFLHHCLCNFLYLKQLS